jgi:maleylacetate reductase
MNGFVYEAHPARVVFGRGARAQLDEETQRLGMKRVLVVGSKRLVGDANAKLGTRSVATIDEVVMHVPIERAAAARNLAREKNVDGLVALGGGSAVGLAKAIAMELALPILAIPTTYSGSEMTALWGLTENGEKKTGRDDKVRPRTVIYDPELTTSLPANVAGPSALNAIAHAMEALYAPKVDPIVMLMAEESVRTIALFSPQIVNHAAPADEAWDGVLYGAWLAGVALDRTTAGVHHKICHVLGGTFKLPHAEAHSVILPYAAAFNFAAAPDAMTRLGRALDSGEPDATKPGRYAPLALWELGRKVGAPASLAALGMKENDLDRAADLATKNPYANPRPVDRAGVRALLQDAFVGHAPRRKP